MFFTKFREKRSKIDLPKNRPCHGFRRHLDGQAKRSEITVFVWECDSKCLLPKLKFPQFLNRNVKILGRRLYSPSLKDVAWLEDAQLFFLIFHTFVCKFGWVDKRLDAVRGKKI